ncbi:MAG TPA: hypothetical protein OIL97_04145 [Oscillospiraceae bacterium]|nr:hypothetical protein [Oscillospiraceae bacterium]
MNNKLPYSHLLYVRQYSIIDNDDKLVVFGVNTKDIFHTMGEFVYRNFAQVKFITYVECTQEKLNHWLKIGFKIHNFKDKYV